MPYSFSPLANAARTISNACSLLNPLTVKSDGHSLASVYTALFLFWSSQNSKAWRSRFSAVLHQMHEEKNN